MSDFQKFSDQVRCPVDHNHVLMRGRAMMHIVRCRAAQANRERKRIKLGINQQRAAGSGTYPSVFPALAGDEIWDDDVPTYQPIVPERADLAYRSHQGDPSFGIDFSEPLAAGSSHYPPVFEALRGDKIWDENVPTYKPDVTQRTDFVIRLPIGLRPKKRKIFTKSERKRFAVLKNQKAKGFFC